MLGFLITAFSLVAAPQPKESPRPTVSEVHVGFVHYEWDVWTSTTESTHVEGTMTGWCCTATGSHGETYEFAGQVNVDGTFEPESAALLGYVLSCRWDDSDPEAAAAAPGTIWNGPSCIAASKILCGSAANVCKLTLILLPDGTMYCSIWCGKPPCAAPPSAVNPIFDPPL